jgi:hypothetical protein
MGGSSRPKARHHQKTPRATGPPTATSKRMECSPPPPSDCFFTLLLHDRFVRISAVSCFQIRGVPEKFRANSDAWANHRPPFQEPQKRSENYDFAASQQNFTAFIQFITPIGEPGGGPTQSRGDQRSSGDVKSKRSGAQKIAQTPPPPFVVRGGALGQRRPASHLQCNEQFQLSHPALTGMLPAVPPTARSALLLPFFLYLCHAHRTTISVATDRLVTQPRFTLYYFSNRLLNILVTSLANVY